MANLDKLCGYGRWKPRPATVIKYNVEKLIWLTWMNAVYFSVVTFATLGFGDVTPIDWLGQLWITLEVVCGYLMLGGLISIFASKFARRS